METETRESISIYDVDEVQVFIDGEMEFKESNSEITRVEVFSYDD